MLALKDPDGEFIQSELNERHGELKSLERDIRAIESQPAGEIDLETVTSALQRLDPVWDVLYPEEQQRVLELLVDRITVSKLQVDVALRPRGIEGIVGELEPIGPRNAR